MDNAELFKERLASLSNALISNTNEALPRVLADIKAAIIADPDCVTIMTPEEIGMIVSGMSKQKGIVIVKATAKKTGASLKALAAQDDCI